MLLNSSKENELSKERNEEFSTLPTTNFETSVSLSDPEISEIDSKDLLSETDSSKPCLDTLPAKAPTSDAPETLNLENLAQSKNDDAPVETYSNVNDDLFGDDMTVDVDQQKLDVKNNEKVEHKKQDDVIDIKKNDKDIFNISGQTGSISLDQIRHDTMKKIDDSIGNVVCTNDDKDIYNESDTNKYNSKSEDCIEKVSDGLEALTEEDKILLEIDSLNMRKENLL